MTNLTNDPEIWQDIPGFEGYYQASNFGRIKSIGRYIKHRYGQAYAKGKLLTSHESLKGYLKVKLYKNGISKTKCVHTLVAKTFVANPNSLIEVNHKDGDKRNNRPGNLEYCTSKQNQRHKVSNLIDPVRYKKLMNAPERIKKISLATTRSKNPCAKKVIDTASGEVFGCVGDAADKYGYTYSQLKQWLNGRRKNLSTLQYLNL